MLRNILLQSIVLSLLLSPFLLSQTTKGLRSQSSAHYQFFYEKRVSQGDIQLLSKALESNFELYRKKLNTGYSGKPRVYIVGSSQRLKNESHIAVYDDAAYNDGRLYVCLS